MPLGSPARNSLRKTNHHGHEYYSPIWLPILLLFGFLPSLPALASTEVLCLGDSLTEGYNLPPAQSFPAQLQTLLYDKGYKDVEVVNNGISGSTTASAYSRLKWRLKGATPPDILILALGANDGLRGQSVEKAEANLRKTIELAKSKNVKILLAGMQIPPNYGKTYADGFRDIFPRLAKSTDVQIIPFLLEGVAAKPELNLADGIHPNRDGYKIVAETVARHLIPLLSKEKDSKGDDATSSKPSGSRKASNRSTETSQEGSRDPGLDTTGFDQ